MYKPPQEILSKLESMDFVLEATRTELQLLYEQHVHFKVRTPIEWEDGYNSGNFVTIGEIDGRPICMSISYKKICGINVLVWEMTSQLVDYKMAEDWLTQFCPAYKYETRCDANNFHQLVTHRR